MNPQLVLQLQTAINNMVLAFQNATTNPKPNYIIDGQNVSWGAYIKMLSDGIKEGTELLNMYQPVFSQSNAL